MEIKILDNTQSKIWDKFVENSSGGTIFHKSWFIESAGIDYTNKYLCILENGEIMAGLPISTKKKYGINFILSPSLVVRQGVIFKKLGADVSEYRRRSQEKELSQNIAAYLKKECGFFLQNFSLTFTDWQPFMWEGYRAEVFYTYVLNNIKDQEKVWQGFYSRLRNNLNKPQLSKIKIIKEKSIDKFIQLYKQTFARQNLQNPVSENILKKIIETAYEHNSGNLYFAVDDKNDFHSAAFVVYDQDCAYYLLGGSDPQFRSSGSISLLLWEIIKDCSNYSQQFDFEGSNIPNIEKHFRTFGGELKPYFKISRANHPLIRILKKFST